MKYFIAFLLFIAVVFFAFFTIDNMYSNRDRQCKEQFGKEWSYTNRSATDCVDNKGNGKFLPE